jgi:hypothetical protein
MSSPLVMIIQFSLSQILTSYYKQELQKNHPLSYLQGKVHKQTFSCPFDDFIEKTKTINLSFR